MPGNSLFGKKKFLNLFTPVRMIIILKTKLFARMQKFDPFCIACGDVQWGSCCGKQRCSSSNEDHVIQQSHFRAQTQTLDVGSQLSLHSCSWEHIHKNQNVQATQCPSVDGWINRMWFIHTMELSVCVCACALLCSTMSV